MIKLKNLKIHEVESRASAVAESAIPSAIKSELFGIERHLDLLY